jgi:hypothetical protein
MKQLLKSMESGATSVKAGPFTHAFKKACEFEAELDAKLLVTSNGLGVSEGFSATGEEDSESDKIRRRHMRRDQTSGSGAGEVGPANDFVFQGAISSVFQSQLKRYLELEEQELRGSVMRALKASVQCKAQWCVFFDYAITRDLGRDVGGARYGRRHRSFRFCTSHFWRREENVSLMIFSFLSVQRSQIL